MKLFNIPFEYDFLKEIVSVLKNENLQNTIIFLPTRRSCNEFKRILFKETKEKAIFLPTIKAIGDIDYDEEILLKNNNAYLQKTNEIKYKITLLQEMLEWSKNCNIDFFRVLNINQICTLTRDLENFLNEVVENELSLDDLSKVIDGDYTEYWQQILDFLQVFGKRWNNIKAEKKLISQKEYTINSIKYNIDYYKKNQPTKNIIFANIKVNIKSTNEFIKTLLQYDNCSYYFYGLDKMMNNDAEWKEVDFYHNQYLFKNLLKVLEKKRDDVKNIKEASNLSNILSSAMLPVNFTYKWKEKQILIQNVNNIKIIKTNNSFDELSVIVDIAINNTDILAIIVNDEVFANQLENTLKQYQGIQVINAFGNKFSRIEYIKYLFLMLDVIKTNFQTIQLLSLLKHPYTHFGYEKDELDTLTELLENYVLREIDEEGYDAIIEKISNITIQNQKDTKKQDLTNFINKIKDGLTITPNGDFAFLLQEHINIFNNIAQIKYYNNIEENEKIYSQIQNFLAQIIEETAEFNVENLEEYSYILDYLLSNKSYNTGYSIRPSITIISPKEATCIRYNKVIIANCNDDSYPAPISIDPYMSREMRKKFGLPEVELSIGASSYDFQQLLFNKNVIMTMSLKDSGINKIKTRFLSRIETFLKCQGIEPLTEEIFKRKKINNKDRIFIPRASFNPSYDKRPSELFYSHIKDLINNPYNFYARNILQLRKLKDFKENKVFILFGDAIHDAFEKYVTNYEKKDKDKLIEYGKEAFARHFVNKVSRELFFIRFEEIANFFIEEDEKSRQNGYKISAEIKESVRLKSNILLSAKIDRIEKDGNKINLIDYKTGNAPNKKSVENGLQPQLPIEALIMQKLNKDCEVEQLLYWQTQGKGDNNEKDDVITINLKENKNLVAKTEKAIDLLIDKYYEKLDDYIAIDTENNEYEHLSRVEEWRINK
ncbi:MAG: double-strand break repair protein AddB [Rickettsiales bacterium]|nr:MAG: double-strand break repair protein AddB [Rickettsiales bacterium]